MTTDHDTETSFESPYAIYWQSLRSTCAILHASLRGRFDDETVRLWEHFLDQPAPETESEWLARDQALAELISRSEPVRSSLSPAC